MTERVYITGLGVVAPFGRSVEAYWNGLLHDHPTPTDADETLPRHMDVRRVYQVPERHRMASTRGVGAGRAVQFALEAATAALADAGLGRASRYLEGAGVAMGNAMGDDVFETRRFREAVPQIGAPSMASSDAGRSPCDADSFAFGVGAAVGHALDLHGPNLSLSTACSAGLYSVGAASSMIRAGAVDTMIVGGAEAISRVAMGCFNRLAAFDPIACRPFAEDRKGTLMGEGAAVVVLESGRQVIERGARTYAEVEGIGYSCDAHHPTIPEPSAAGAIAAARAALGDARMTAESIGCVLAHGTGTQQNDIVESLMLETVLGDRLADVPVTAIKAKLGHSGGAAGAFQCLTAALILRSAIVPPCGPAHKLDPRCRLRLVREDAERLAAPHLLLNSYAFGGNNISILVGRASS